MKKNLITETWKILKNVKTSYVIPHVTDYTQYLHFLIQLPKVKLNLTHYYHFILIYGTRNTN